MNDDDLKDEIKNHPEQLYKGSDPDKELSGMIDKWQSEMELQHWVSIPSKKFCMEIASKLPNGSYAELIDNTEKIRKYLEERI